jgi:hypothetical protein
LKELVFAVPSSEKDKVQKILEENPYDDVSFARTGYTFKESAALGLAAGKYVLYFKAEDEAASKLAAKLKETAQDKLAKATAGKQLGEEQKTQILKGLEAKEVKGLEEIQGAEKDKVLAAIKAEEEAALGGFGSIFG